MDIFRRVFPVASLQPYQISLLHLSAVARRCRSSSSPGRPQKTITVQLKSPVQDLDHFQHGGLIQTITGKDVMGYRPAVHHHHPDDHLAVARLAVPAISETAQSGWAGSLRNRWR